MTACQGLPDNLIEEIERMAGKQERLQKLIEKRKIDLRELSNHPEADLLLHYAEEEKWSENLAQAEQQLDNAKLLYSESIIPLFDKNDPVDTNHVIKLNKEFSEIMYRYKRKIEEVNWIKGKFIFRLNLLL